MSFVHHSTHRSVSAPYMLGHLDFFATTLSNSPLLLNYPIVLCLLSHLFNQFCQLTAREDRKVHCVHRGSNFSKRFSRIADQGLVIEDNGRDKVEIQPDHIGEADQKEENII